MPQVTGAPGELRDRLLDAVDRTGPQLRAVATTLLIKVIDVPAQELELMEAMVASDDAAAMIDPVAAASAALQLRSGLAARLDALAVDHGEAVVAATMRDYVAGQVRRWASRAVDDADNRRRAERFLAWAERPGQLAAAQQRGLFAGMDAEDFRRMADSKVRAPVTPETAVDVWSQVDSWLAALAEHIGDEVIAAWRAAAA